VITDPHRHYLELSFLFHLLGGFQDESFLPLLEERPEYPVLGICLGMQSMNVATGGDMIRIFPPRYLASPPWRKLSPWIPISNTATTIFSCEATPILSATASTRCE
jgi:hypothetical protein